MYETQFDRSINFLISAGIISEIGRSDCSVTYEITDKGKKRFGKEAIYMYGPLFAVEKVNELL